MRGGRRFDLRLGLVASVIFVPLTAHALDYRMGIGGTIDHDIDTNHRHEQGQTVDVAVDVTWAFSDFGYTRAQINTGAGYNDFIKKNGDAGTIEHWSGNLALGLTLPVDEESFLHLSGALHGAQTAQDGFEATKYGPVFGFGYVGRKYWWDVDLGPQINSHLILEEPDPNYDRQTSNGKYGAVTFGVRLRKQWAIALQQRGYDYRRLPFINTEVTGYREDFTQIMFYWVGRLVKKEPQPEF